MTLDQAIKKLDAAIAGLDAETKNATEELSLSLMGMVVNRIQQKGLPGRKYSTNKLPEFYFFDRWNNAGGKALYERSIKQRSKKPKGQQGISYEEWRIANGLQVDHVDLTFTGRTMQNLGIVNVKKEGDYYVVELGGTNIETIEKIEYTTLQFGKWLKPIKEEADILKRQYVDRMSNYLNRILA